MFERKLTTLGKQNKATLREFAGRKRMSEEEYIYAMEAYNNEVDRLNEEIRFYADVVIRRTFKKNWYENGMVSNNEGDIIIINQRTLPMKLKQKDINKEIYDLYNDETSNYIDEVISYTLHTFTPKQFTAYKRAKNRIMMKNAIILERQWLKFSENIAKEAYDETNNTCVYHQLTTYLLNPPTGNPTKFINKIKVSENGLFKYFQQIIEQNYNDIDCYSNFNLESGVCSELIRHLCKDTGRSMYAFDSNTKLFDSYIVENKNYSPIIFYKIDDHMYLINDPIVFKSIGASVREGKKLVSGMIIEKEEEEAKKNKSLLSVFHNGWVIENAKEYEEGIYLLQQPNVYKEFFQYINKYNSVPDVKCRNNSIIGFKYKYQKDKEKRTIYVVVDTNYKDRINYFQIKNVAEKNGIKYINEGIGSVILDILKQNEEKNKKIEKVEIDEDRTDLEKNEEEFTDDIIKSPFSSSFNTIVKEKIIDSHLFKSWAFIEKIQDTPMKEIEVIEKITEPSISIFGTEYNKITINKTNKLVEKDTFKLDIRKCRKNIMYYNNFDYPVYSVMDFPKPFSGLIQCGLYFVKTEALIPFRGNGWYLQPTIQYGLDMGLIEKKDIQYEFIPSNKLSCDYFKKHIDCLLDAFKIEPDLQKLAINSFIGLLGRTRRIHTKCDFTKSPYDASEKIEDTNVFIESHKLDNGEILYEIIKNDNVFSDTSDYIIYKMILEMEAIELHKLENLIINAGGIPLDRNTDAIRYYAKKEIIINEMWDFSNSKYKTEEPKILQIEKLPLMIRKTIIDPFEFELNWTIFKDDITDFESMKLKAKQIIDKNISLCINGRAGTAKTTMVNYIKDELINKGIKFAGFSPTNKGARLIQGETIHSFYHKFSQNKNALFGLLKSIEYIFIDEVSMMLEKFYHLFICVKSVFPHIKFIISGDYGQLPPVCDSWIGDYENSAGLYNLCDGNKLELTKCRRSDDILFNLCKTLDVDNIIHNKPFKPSYLNLAYRHSTRKRVNKECMERYIKQNKCNTILIKENPNNPNSQEIKLGIGMPVICFKTNKKYNILNSEKFLVKEINENEIIINDNVKDIKILIKDFNKYLYLGFCITIHASQGETFTTPYNIYDWNFTYMCNKAKYVALSRATDIKNINILV